MLDEHRKFWLAAYGVPAADLKGTTALAYIETHGIPVELAALAASVNDALHHI